MKMKVFRPHLDDVENLSYGRGAKKQRGTGSRHVCHRLNKEERRQYEVAKRDGYLTVKGTGYRKERKGSPIHNTFRQRCDALEEICVVHEKKRSESGLDRVIIDFSTLRIPNDSQFVSSIVENVFRVKYWEIYDRFQKYHDHSNRETNGVTRNAAVAPPSTGATAVLVDASTLNTPINWDTVKSKPIWGVDERLIAVTCERDIARSLAIDVLGESNSNFEIIRTSLGEVLEVEHNKSPVHNDVNEVEKIENLSAGDDHDDYIDWDDI